MKLMRPRGFTLIELLVVIAIIAILASIILASLGSAQSKSRDVRRRADLKQLQTALELYQNDYNSYPSTGGSANWHGNCSGYGSYGTSGAGGWVPNLAPSYIPVLPLDPKPVPPSACYLYRSDGTNYKLLAYNTVENTVLSTDTMYDPARPTGKTYAVYTPGARTW